MKVDRSTLHILIVDDEHFMLRLLAQMLRGAGVVQVTACENGQHAVAQLGIAGAPIDLILLDVNMPQMDGVQFIRQLAVHQYTGAVALVSGEDRRMLESIERLLEAHQLRSLGCLTKPVNSEELEALLERLDPNQDPARSGVRPKPRLSADDLRVAIGRNELVNYYQPKIALTTGELIGVEALVRWQPAHGALILPDQFIALAEESGLIEQITHSVMLSAVRQAKAWWSAGIELNVAINVSMNDLVALDFPDRAQAITEASGLEPSAITFEVTESRVLKHLSAVLEVLSRLRLKRFRLAIDDFGTGHSSLAQLRDLPFDELKVDRGFVNAASSSATRRSICEASLRMAAQLSMHTVAEGIERDEDWQMLRSLGCQNGQGYRIARPMPAEELQPWLRAWRATRGLPSPDEAGAAASSKSSALR